MIRCQEFLEVRKGRFALCGVEAFCAEGVDRAVGYEVCQIDEDKHFADPRMYKPEGIFVAVGLESYDGVVYVRYLGSCGGDACS